MSFVVAVMGLFGIGELLLAVEEEAGSIKGVDSRIDWREVLRTLVRMPRHGITLLRSSITIDGTGGVSTPSLWLAFRQGAVTCLLNPKAYLFVLAVYPQFLLPGYGPIWPQALVMGVMTVLMQFMIYGGLAVAAGPSREFLTSRPGMTRLIGRAAGGLFIAIAIMTTLR